MHEILNKNFAERSINYDQVTTIDLVDNIACFRPYIIIRMSDGKNTCITYDDIESARKDYEGMSKSIKNIGILI